MIELLLYSLRLKENMIELLLMLLILFVNLYDGTSVNYQKVANLNGNNVLYVSIPTLSDFTITFWLKTKDVGSKDNSNTYYGGKSIINGKVTNHINDFGITLYDGKLAFGDDVKTIFTPNKINNGDWSYYSVMKLSNNYNIY